MGSLKSSPDASEREVLLQALRTFSREDFSVRLPPSLDCLDDELVSAFNAAAETHQRYVQQDRQFAEQGAPRHESAGKKASAPRRSRQMPDFLASALLEQRALVDSILMLAKLLADNGDANLTTKQIDQAQTIYSAGTHVLSLIDDIFNLGEMDSGTVMLNVGPERLSDLCNDFVRSFHQMARDKGLEFEVDLVPGLPAEIRTDGKRLRQILRNLLSNAFKFTQQGEVMLRIAPAEEGWAPDPASAGEPVKWVEFSVSDTGIGIPASKQQGIFEAFHQAPETADGELDGMGLGLSICRKLTGMLGGHLRVSSSESAGSRFSLYLPLPREVMEAAGNPLSRPPTPSGTANSRWRPAAQGRRTIRDVLGNRPPLNYGPHTRWSRDGVVLIVEGDAKLAALMLEQVQRNGYQGEAIGDIGKLWTRVRNLEPDAIILGMNLPGSDGWTVFDLLKRDPETRQLPIGMIFRNGNGEAPEHKCLQIRPLGGGAIDTCSPAEVVAGLRAMTGCDIGRLLVVDADERCLGGAWSIDGMEVTVIGSGARAIDRLAEETFDAMVVGAVLEDMSGTDFMRRAVALNLRASLPVALIGGRGELDRGSSEVALLTRGGDLDGALTETTLFLHRAVGNPAASRSEIPASRRAASELAGRKVLIIDDDIRNIYAMTGALEQQGMIVLQAEKGAEGLDMLRDHPDTGAVLLDAAMAGLDSHELIRNIRGIEGFKALPIIMVAARAAHGNHEHCIEGGASDTIDKPVNVEQLLSLLRAWLLNARGNP